MSVTSPSAASSSTQSTPALAGQPSLQGAVRWNIDPSHSVAHFTVRHMMISNVRGQISGLAGHVLLSADPARTEVHATLDIATIDTREAKRDAHLRSADFFDVEKFPTMSFDSTRVEQTGPESLTVHGNLALHGVTRPVALQVELAEGEHKDPWGNTRRGATAKTQLNRKDFNLGWNVALEAGGVMVGEKVTVELELEVIKAP